MTREAEIEARLEKATKGPWESYFLRSWCHNDQDHGGGLHSISVGKCHNTNKICEGHNNGNWARVEGPGYYKPEGGGDERMYSEDADIIAHAPDDLRYLLEKVRRLEDVIRGGIHHIRALNGENGVPENCPTAQAMEAALEREGGA